MRRHIVEGLVDGVVGADQEVSPGRRQLARRGQHEVGHPLQIATVQAVHVSGERRRVHGDFGVRVRAEQRGPFGADGAVTKRGPFRGAADDSDVLWHGLGHGG